MKTTVKLPRHRSTWGYWSQKRMFNHVYPNYTSLSVYNEGVLIYIGTVFEFGLYRVRCQGLGWKWGPPDDPLSTKEIIKLTSKVQWTE